MNQSDRLVPLAEALDRLGGISKATYYREVHRGKLPPLVMITRRRGGIPETEINRIIAERSSTAERETA